MLYFLGKRLPLDWVIWHSEVFPTVGAPHTTTLHRRVLVTLFFSTFRPPMVVELPDTRPFRVWTRSCLGGNSNWAAEMQKMQKKIFWIALGWVRKVSK